MSARSSRSAAPIDIVIATRNAGKVRELCALMRVPGIRWRSLQEFPPRPTIRETGKTFLENAAKKAIETARQTGCLALADDSGLEVDALGGAPGIHSARYAGGHGGDEANNVKLLRALRDLPVARRKAGFRCVLVVANASRVLASAEGVFRGRIAREPAGSGGFGYDPIFFIPSLRKTSGELSARVKSRISHRAKAARRMQRLLRAALRANGFLAGASTAGSTTDRARTGSPG